VVALGRWHCNSCTVTDTACEATLSDWRLATADSALVSRHDKEAACGGRAPYNGIRHVLKIPASIRGLIDSRVPEYGIVWLRRC